MKNKVCVYAICKNEGKFVESWYEYVKEADAIVVVDTGSTDDTIEKLKKCEKVQLYETTIDPFRFDVARNYALDRIPDDCNICVASDLDETMEPKGWSDILREKWIDGIHERAIYKYTWSHLANGNDGRIYQYDKIHSKDWYWRYPVHEMLWHKTRDTYSYDWDKTLRLFNDIYSHHWPDKSKSRSQYYDLLELRAKEDPNDYYGLIYLAHEYIYHGEYQKSIDLLDKIEKKFPDRLTNLEYASCYLFRGDGYKKLNKPLESKQMYLKAISIEPTYREPYLGIASVCIDLKEYDIAIGYIKQALKNSVRHYTWLERDLAWAYEPYDMLSIACFYAGYKQESLAYAQKAYSMDTSNDRLKNNVDIILKLTSDAELIQ